MFLNAYSFSFDPKVHTEKVLDLDVVTVPDESYSVKELFLKFARGTGPQIIKQSMYDSDVTFDSVDLEKLRDSDLFEIEQYKMRLAETMLEHEKVVKEDLDKRKAERKKELEELKLIKEVIKARKSEQEAKGKDLNEPSDVERSD